MNVGFCLLLQFFSEQLTERGLIAGLRSRSGAADRANSFDREPIAVFQQSFLNSPHIGSQIGR